jgi:superfamily II DNA or RNA helicase
MDSNKESTEPGSTRKIKVKKVKEPSTKLIKVRKSKTSPKPTIINDDHKTEITHIIKVKKPSFKNKIKSFIKKPAIKNKLKTLIKKPLTTKITNNTNSNTNSNINSNINSNQEVVDNRRVNNKQGLNKRTANVQAPNKHLIIENDTITPQDWILPNKKRFMNWINTTFLKYQIKDAKSIYEKSDEFKLFSYQKFARDYIQDASPYRGILLYHGLGSGKTCAAVAIAENLKTSRDIVVMLPASLKNNFKKGLLQCGDPEYVYNKKLIDSKYTFITYNSPTKLKQIIALGDYGLDNKVLVVDEIHNLISMMVDKDKAGREIYKRIMKARNLKLICLSGTPIINYPYEISLLCNILKGYIQSITFEIQGSTSGKKLMKNDINHLLDVLNNVNKIDIVNEPQYGNNNIVIYLNIFQWDFTFKTVINDIISIGHNNGVLLAPVLDETGFIDITYIPLFPEKEEEFYNYFVKSVAGGDVLKESDMLMRRMSGLISYVKGENEDLYPEIRSEQFVPVPMSDYQYNRYELIRDIYERPQEKRIAAVKNDTSSQKSTSVRVHSRQISNFIFPEGIKRPYPDKIMSRIYKTHTNNKLNNNSNNDIGLGDESIRKREQMVIDNLFKQLDKHASTYLTPGPDGLDKYSPKMKAVLDNLSKTNGLVFVYSQFIRLEGINIFTRILDNNGYSAYGSDDNKPKYAIYSGGIKNTNREEMLNTFNNTSNSHGQHIKILLATAAGAEGIHLQNIRQIHILEPYWHEVRMKQIIGRGRRMNSHINLPKSERNIDIFRYLSVFTEEQKKVTRERKPITTDEHILQTAMRKAILTDQIQELMKKASVDCNLNARDHKINCYTFGRDLTGLAYKPNIREDFAYLRANVDTKSIDIELKLGLVTPELNILVPNPKTKKLYYYNDTKFKKPIKMALPQIKECKKVLINFNTNQVFNYSAGKAGGNQIIIGTIKNNRLVKHYF